MNDRARSLADHFESEISQEPGPIQSEFAKSTARCELNLKTGEVVGRLGRNRNISAEWLIQSAFKIDFAQAQGESHGHTVVFLYPSSIAVYGLPNLETKAAAGAVREHEWNNPTTMYGCNKLYCEHLGRYFAFHYKQLAAETLSGKVDFRAIRFPGLISAVTVPSGGTSDFAPEMIHAAAHGEPYACFVRPDTRIPFMVMSDAVDGLVRLARAERARLGRTVYNITAFNPSADEIRSLVLAGFPGADISFEPDLKRQVIVDSWPADVDDSAARSDWGLGPRYDLEGGFNEFLIPRIRGRY